EQVNQFYAAFAQRLASDPVWEVILEANRIDVEDARRRDRSTTRLVASDRLRQGMIEGLRGWASVSSARGRVLETIEHDGWAVDLIAAELGVVAFVFEGRPNVLADATGVLKGGNTVVFRIGRDALRTASAIMDRALLPSLAEAGLPSGAVRLVQSTEHAAGWALFGDRRLSLAVARGSGPAVAALGSLARQAGVPVSLHGTGGAWIVATGQTAVADLEQAVTLSLDRKVCNTLNVCCIPRARAEALVPAFLRGLSRAGERRQQAFKLHVVEGDETEWTRELFSRSVPITRAEGVAEERQAESLAESDLGREWEWEETPEVSLKLVDDLDHAVRLFNAYSPKFVASLISSDPGERQRFFAAVNAPFVGDGHTRWVDGQLALRRPELGLSNWEYGRLLARGGVLSGDGIYTVRTRARQL
ncbi:MAG TPA: aldehyde dehydrogenase family protein, partial [Polyangiaceae bacterium]|nr:aldehyde dehydrogenase family protein [Polyangiaceae bacterium]